MKVSENNAAKRYLLAFYPASGYGRPDVKITLRPGSDRCWKKRSATHAKKSLLTLQSH